MGEFSFTPEQQRAIETTGRSLLVSAAAGSGKTAVLAARCAYLICDAPPAVRCNVDQLLVLTFTDAAATEMRDRIVTALRERLARSPGDERIREQISGVDTAQISTVHSFCLWVIRRWFPQAGIDPTATVMDADEAALLRGEVLDAIFQRLYESANRRFRKGVGRAEDASNPSAEGALTEDRLDPGMPSAESFIDLVETYGLGRDQDIARFVTRLDDFLSSLPDPEDWLQAARQRHVGQPEMVILELIRLLRDELDAQAEHCDRIAAALRAGHPVGQFYGDRIGEYAESLHRWQEQLPEGSNHREEALAGFERVRAGIESFSFPMGPTGRSPRKSKDEDEVTIAVRELASGLRDDAKKKLFDKRLRERFGLFGVEELLRGLQETAPHVGTLCNLTLAFREAYGRRKRDLNLLDFSDLERLAYDVLRDRDDRTRPSETAVALRSRFAHVLVDEFQDINPLQEAMIRLVSREGDPRQAGNSFVVGDVKQSIYRFRLAEPTIFTARLTNFRDHSFGAPADPGAPGPAAREGKVISLQRNFRSRPEILDAVNQLFRPLMRRDVGDVVYDDEAELRPGRKVDVHATPQPVEVHLLPGTGTMAESNEEDEEDQGGEAEDIRGAAAYHADSSRWRPIEREAYLIGSMIREWKEAGSLRIRGAPVDYRDVVILLRAKRVNAEQMAAVLALMGIPAHADVGGSLFDCLEVRDVVAALEILDNPQQDIPLASVLRSGMLGESFSVDELVDIRCLDHTVPFHAVLRAYAEHGPDDDLKERVHRLLACVARFRQEASRRPLADVVWRLFEEHGYLACVGGLPRGDQRLANLHRFHDLSRQFGTFRRQGLHRFLRFVESLQDRERDVAESAPAGISENVVRILSIHQAKGLEFPVVVVAGLGTDFNLRDRRGRMIFERKTHIGLRVVDTNRMIEYPSAAHPLVVEEIERTTREEELRVLYVAMTRAQQKLVLVGTGEVPSRERASLNQRMGRPSRFSVLTARTPLSWIIPVWSHDSHGAGSPGDGGSGNGSVVRFCVHSASEASGWRLDDPNRRSKRQLLEAVACGCSLPPGEPLSSSGGEADEVESRLGYIYPFAGTASIRAVMAAGEFIGRHDFTRYAEQSLPRRTEDTFDVPESKYGGSQTRDAAHRGIVMHAVLEHLDFQIAVNHGGLVRELQRMEQTGVITPAERACLDMEALVWFVETPLARQIRNAGAAYQREFAFVAAEPVTWVDPSIRAGNDDFVLVRGIVDGVLLQGDRVNLVDFKTDAVLPAQVGERMEVYRPQLQAYARAVRRLWSKPVPTGWLVFLTARECRELELAPA